MLALEILNRAELVRPVHLLGTLADELLTCAKVIFEHFVYVAQVASGPVAYRPVQRAGDSLQFADIEVYADKAGYAIAVLDIRGRRKKIAPVAGLEIVYRVADEILLEEFIQKFVVQPS